MSVRKLCIFILVLINYVLQVHSEETKIACQYDTIKLECQKDHLINIEDANYGRTSVSVCGLSGNVDCRTSETLKIMKERCNNQQSCNVKAVNEIFGEPCLNTIKYLEVTYTCKENECGCKN